MNILYKRINYLLKSVNLSFEIIVGLKPRKIYKLLKKVAKISEDFNFSKKELKKISTLISNDNFKQSKIIIKISQLIFKTKKRFKKMMIFKKLLLIVVPFLGTFFDKKQIIRC